MKPAARQDPQRGQDPSARIPAWLVPLPLSNRYSTVGNVHKGTFPSGNSDKSHSRGQDLEEQSVPSPLLPDGHERSRSRKCARKRTNDHASPSSSRKTFLHHSFRIELLHTDHTQVLGFSEMQPLIACTILSPHTVLLLNTPPGTQTPRITQIHAFLSHPAIPPSILSTRLKSQILRHFPGLLVGLTANPDC